MTPAQVEEYARRRFNAVNETTYYTQDELFKIIYDGERELALEALVIEAKDTSTTTVDGTRNYSFPTNLIAIYRIEYNGNKLQKVDFRDDDRLTLDNATSTATGTPQYYQEWNDTVYLRPIPNAAQTLTIYGYQEPTLLTTASTTLSVPTRFHMDLVDYVSIFLAAKEKDYEGAEWYRQRWEQSKLRAIQWQKRRRRTDSFASVKDEESMSRTIVGAV